MSRRYCDQVSVRVAGVPVGLAGECVAPDEEPPAPKAFRWRWYDVIAVVARWVEADQWWTASLTASSGRRGLLDRVVWRVEAQPRHGVGPGVYDLCHIRDPDQPKQERTGGQWLLVRSFD